jgi:RNA polymerase sigma-70 factor (ECF subfamily)
MDDETERRIARGLRAGEADAWRALYDAFAEPVWRSTARLMGPSSTDVADVVQETFLAAARSAGNYDPDRGSLGFWLHGIARNQIALHFRKSDQRRRLVERAEQNGQFAGSLASRAPDPVEAAELATQVRSVLCELPPDYESLLTAKYLDDVSVEQLAQRERSSEVAIRSKLARARDAFRRAFAKYQQKDAASGGRKPSE